MADYDVTSFDVENTFRHGLMAHCLQKRKLPS